MSDPSDPRAEWETLAQKELGDESVDSLLTQTRERIEVRPLYTSDDVRDPPPPPAVYPFRRGPHATMYRKRPWTIRQYAGFSTAEDSNAFFKQALEAGQRGLSVAFDLATHRGYDSDHPRALHDVGRAGVAVDSVLDMQALFAGIPLGEMSVSMTMNGAVLPVLAAFIVAAEEAGIQKERLTGTIQNDILKEFMVRNTYIYPLEPSMRIVADIIEYASANLPRFNSVSISGYHLHEAGAPADLELAFTIADGLEYVRAALERGLTADAFLPRLSFFFGVGMDFFMEVAKLRAARELWATEIERRFAPKDPRSRVLRMHCQTSGVSLAAQDPLNNVVRTTLEALAAVLGGTQSLHTNAYDEAVSLPTDEAARLARNTQLILQHETGVMRSADPLGGSYYVEALTQELLERARETLQKLDGMGGMRRAIELGVPKQMIEQAATLRQARIDAGKEVIVGVNAYLPPELEPLQTRVIDHDRVRRSQLARLARLRAERHPEEVQAALAGVEEAARTGENLVPKVVQAMRLRATVGEVSEALARVFGRYEAKIATVTGVYAKERANDADWQQLIERVRAFAKAQGRQPRILVAKLGQDGHDRGAHLIASGLADLGFDVDVGPLFATSAEVALAAADNDVHVVGISTQAGAHMSLLPELLTELSERGAGGVAVVVGGIVPEADRAALLAFGVKAVIGPGTPVSEAARMVLDAIEGPFGGQA